MAPFITSNPLCACGCMCPVILNRDGRPNRYIHGHTARGRPKSAEERRKQSEAMQGRPGYWRGKTMDTAARLKMSAAKKGKPLTPEHRRKIGQAGEGRPRSEATLAKMRGRRHSPETRRTCRSCGSRDQIHAHHIKPFATHRDLRFDVSNGITLCRSCHGLIHGRAL